MNLSFEDITALSGYLIIALAVIWLAMNYLVPELADGLRFYFNN